MSLENLHSIDPEDVITKENKQEKPRLKFEIFFSSHDLSEDLVGFNEKLKNVDILAIESSGYKIRAIEQRQKIANGTLSLNNIIVPNAGSFDAKLTRIIAKTNKIITTLDVPFGHELSVKINDLQVMFENTLHAFLRKENKTENVFRGLLRDIRKYIVENAETQKKREKYISAQIEPVLNKILDANPELKSRPEIKILIMMGSVHTNIYHNLVRRAESAEAYFPNRPHIYPIFPEILRRQIFGKNIDDNMIIRGIFDVVMMDLKELGVITRETIWSLTIDDIKEILKNIKVDQNNHYDYASAEEAFLMIERKTNKK